MKTFHSFLRSFVLPTLLVGLAGTALLSTGACNNKQKQEFDCRNATGCKTHADCGSEEICVAAGTDCSCEAATCDERDSAGVIVECVSDTACTGSETCDPNSCTCGGGGPPPATFPAVTTGCTTDADGYIVAADSACFIEVDALLAGPTATITVEASVLDPGMTMSFLEVIGFGETTGYEWTGYQCGLSRSGSDVSGTLFDVNRSSVDSTTWTVPAGPLPVTVTQQVDSGATSATCTLSGNGAPSTPLQSNAMGTANSQKVAIAVRNVKVYRLVISEP